jgi:hypothetical protein
MGVREPGGSVLPEALQERLMGLMERTWMAVVEGGLTAAEAEEEMVGMTRRLGCELLGSALSERYGRHEGRERSCDCGEAQEFERYQPKVVRTLLGEIDYERAYYRCSQCKATYYAGDEELGITETSYTLPAQEAASLTCSSLPFGEGRELLSRLTGLEVSESHLQRLSEGHGERLEQELSAERAGLFEGRLECLPEDRPDRLYVTLDATKTLFRDAWHETRVGAIYAGEPDEEGRDEAGRTTYVTGVQESVADFGQRLYQEAQWRGMQRAGEVVVVGDGAPWIWNLAAEHFPDRIEILDFYHAAERLHSVGRALYGEGTDRARRFAESNRARLLEGRVEDVLRSLRALKPSRQEGREAVRLAIGYFRDNRARMRYDLFRARGCHIGSGVVEAACKHVVGSRCKRSGMRWSKPGAQSILSLRCLLLNQRWDDYWKPIKSAA